MSLRIEVSKVIQNNQGFLLGIFRMSEMRKFVKFTNRIVIDFDEANMPIYNDEVQRKISPSKVDAIADFLIHDNNSFFPTNIVIAVPMVAIESIEDQNSQSAVLTLKDFVEKEIKKEDGNIYLTIIDGQHRVAGIEKAIKRTNESIHNLQVVIATAKEPKPLEAELDKHVELLRRLENFEIVVTFFIDPTTEYQASIFSTINRTQTKVSEDLVYSLFGLSKIDSPQRSSLEVIMALNSSEKSPLYNRIKISGANYPPGGTPSLSQAMAVKSILFEISPDIKQAEIEKNKPRSYISENPTNEFLVFRSYYGNNEDVKIVQILNSFFKAVRDSYHAEDGSLLWNLDSQFNILHTTIGFRALFMIMVELIKKAKKEENRFSYEYYKGALEKASSVDFLDNNNPKKFPLTSKSINLLYNAIGAKAIGWGFVPKAVIE